MPILSEIQTLFARLQEGLQETSVTELLLSLSIPLIALLIGTHAQRYTSRHEKKKIGLILLDYVGPMIAPLIAIIATGSALALARAAGKESILLAYMLKFFIGWFAVALVMVMSTKRTAGWFVALVIIPITLLHVFDLWDVTTESLESVKFSLGNTQLNLYMVFRGIIVLALLQWATSFTVTVVDKRLNKVHDLRASNRTLILKIFQIVLYCFVFLFAMQLLGISLTALGVFGGALGVGLGFGLQKIASNFISGIILLFEKSIEIGDLIELQDGTLGYVRQTYARYTRLEMVNGKEMFIPNEEFISQRVISWTHSNKKAQVEILVGVAYDSDITLARKLMTDAANAHPSRLKDIDTACYMNAFGESSIELKLLFWVRDITAGRLGPKSDVMFAIFEAFRANNISIPYPQREVRVLNSTSLDPSEKEEEPK